MARRRRVRVVVVSARRCCPRRRCVRGLDHMVRDYLQHQENGPSWVAVVQTLTPGTRDWRQRQGGRREGAWEEIWLPARPRVWERGTGSAAHSGVRVFVVRFYDS